MVRRLKPQQGFTLVELLVVVGIMAVLAAAIIPSIRGVSDSYSLTSAADQVVSAMNLARQTAIARNRPVEVRIYELPSPLPGQPAAYRLLVAVIPNTSDPAATEWISKPRPLPNGIIFDNGSRNPQFSTLIANASDNDGASPAKNNGANSGVPALVKGLKYVSFNIRPDGGTDLDPASTDPWTLSLRVERDQSGDFSRPSNNFITFLLDPVLGRVKVFRP
jgi:uncharacterized protein (TIGR02596 family)